MPSVLLVDDDAHDRELALAALQRVAPGAEIIVARDGEEALTRLAASPVPDNHHGCPDLVLLDYKMPKVSGADVLRRLRAEPAACRAPIIVFSSSDSERDIDECYALGASAFVRKPSSYADLKDALSTIFAFWVRWAVPKSPATDALR